MFNYKYSQEQKVLASISYLSGEKSALQIALELGMSKYGKSEIRGWAKRYRAYGEDAFAMVESNKSYSKEFKNMVVQDYLSGAGGAQALAVKYNISSPSVLKDWIKKYNNHIELEDYNPKPEVYMANTLKTTYEEKIEIVKYCLAHDRDIKETAAKYGCNYAQLYQWIRKYEANGETSLIDKRGKRKKEAELTDLEIAQKKIAQLEREKEEYRKKYELLKKAEKRERW